MKQKKVLGLIPARGGSKGLPRKNIRLLCDRPLIEYTIEAAIKAQSLDRIIVSTDDNEIAAVAEDAGAEVPFLRPADYATDTASSISVVHHAIQWLEENDAYQIDAIALLSPTCPLRTTDQIDAAIDLLYKSRLDSAVTVFPVPHHPYFIYALGENDQLSELITMPDKPLRRQELPPYYAHSQSIMVSRTSYIKTCGQKAAVLNFDSTAGLKIDYHSALDIDTMADLMVADVFMKRRMSAKEEFNFKNEITIE